MTKKGQRGPRGPKDRQARTRDGAWGAPSGPGGWVGPILAISHEPNVGAAETKPPTHRDFFPKFGPNMGEMYLYNTSNGFIDFFASFWYNKILISLF